MAASPSERLLALIASCDGVERLLAGLVDAVAADLGADAVYVMLVDPDGGLVLRAATRMPELIGRMRLGPGVGVNALALGSERPIWISKNLAKHPKFVGYPLGDEAEFQSGAFVAIRAEGPPLGVLSLRRWQEWPSRRPEVARLEAWGLAAAQALAAVRRIYEAASKTDRLGALSEVSKLLASSPYLEEVLQLLVNFTAQRFGYRVCTVRLLDPVHNELVLRATQSQVKAYQSKPAIKLGQSIAGRVIELNRTMVVADVQTDPDYIGHDLAREQGLRSMVCVPLTLQDRPLGVLSCYTGEVRDFPPDEVAALETLSKQAAIAIEHAKLQVRHTLMQEMHHRVKNSLQQVASLLRLQLRHHHYESIEDALSDSLGRILAIASVHDLLSRDDLDHVGLKTLAESLVQHQQQSLMQPDKRIRFEVRGEDLRLNMMQATQVALVLNELIQNAVEHGFEIADEGDVHVNIEVEEERVGLWVSNNGDPLPEGFDLAASSHLGLQIVQNLARALGGSFRLEDRLGWAVAEVRFSRLGGE